MASCVSCGKETDPGEIFCLECRAAIGSGQEEAVREAEDATRVRKRNGSAQEEAAGLTPPAQKKVIRKGEEAKRAYESAAKVDRAKAPAIARKKVSKRVIEERGRTSSTKKERVTKSSLELVGRTALTLTGLGRKAWDWLKKLALAEKTAYDALDWAAAAVGMFSCLILVVFFFFFGLLRFEWVFSEQSSPLANKVLLRGADLGAPGILLMSLGGLALVLLGADVLTWVVRKRSSPKIARPSDKQYPQSPWAKARGRRSPINLIFLSALSVILCMILLLVCLLSDGILLRYAGKKYAGKASFFREAEREEKVEWASRKFMGGAYLCLLMAVTAFASVGALLAENKELPHWVGWIIYRMKRKKRGRERSQRSEGKGEAKKSGL